MCVLYRNPNRWTDWDEIWQRDGPRGGRFLIGGWPCTPPPPGTGCIKGVWGASGVSTVHFGENFIKQKLQGTPDLVGWVTFLDPKSGSHVLLEPWSLTMKDSL